MNCAPSFLVDIGKIGQGGDIYSVAIVGFGGFDCFPRDENEIVGIDPIAIGYFFGKHQLIALSPKKTWEGYIGGAVTTCFFSIIVDNLLLS
jgi:hypothetical protein